MTKYLLYILIIVFTSFCGYLLAKKYRKKKSFYAQFVVFNERFISELSYFRRPIYEFISSYEYFGEFLFFLKEFLSNHEKNTVFLQELMDDTAFYFLKSDEKSMVVNYFSMLGRGDSHSQKVYFTSMNEILKKAEVQAISNCKKYSELYLKMGFLIGLLIIILII